MLKIEDFNWKSKEGLGRALRILGKVFMAIGISLVFISISPVL